MSLPDFCAKDLGRLPPVDVTHCDVSAILREVQSLRGEVRQISELRDEVSALRQQIFAQDTLLDTFKVLRKEVQDLHADLADLCTTSSTLNAVSTVDFPPLPKCVHTGDNVLATNRPAGQSDHPSAADRLKSAVESGAMLRTGLKSRPKVVVCKSSNPKLQAINGDNEEGRHFCISAPSTHYSK